MIKRGKTGYNCGRAAPALGLSEARVCGRDGGVHMCLSNVYYSDLEGKRTEIMREVARMEARSNGYLLIGLLGEEKFVEGHIEEVDFVDQHSVVLKQIRPGKS